MSISATRVLLLANLLALAGLAYLWVDKTGYLRPIVWLAPQAVPAVMTPPSFTDKAGSTDPAVFTATLERPLFAPDRRPPPPVLPPPPPPPPDPLANVKLLGLYSGEVSGVLIRSEGRVRRVNLNQKLGEWTLQGIEDRSATFARGGGTRVIRLDYARLNTPAPIVQKAPQTAPQTAVQTAAQAASGASTPAPAGAAAVNPQDPVAVRRQEDARKEEIRAQMRARSQQKKP